MPVTVHDGRLDLLARNKAAQELLGASFGNGPFDRNIAYQAFTNDTLARLLGDEGSERLLRAAAAEFRIALSRYPEDAYLRSLLAELTATSQSFRDRWEEGEVGASRSAVKRMRHPTHGWARFDIEVLHDPERDHWIMLYTPQEDE